MIVYSPLSNDPVFREEFQSPSVDFVPANRNRNRFLSRINALISVVETTRLAKQNPIATLVTLKNQLKKENPVRFVLFHLLTALMDWAPFIFHCLKSVQGKLRLNRNNLDLLRDKKVELVFLTHGYVDAEIELALAAKFLNIPVVNMIHSWDNITSKSGMRQLTSLNVGQRWMPEHVDRAIVWNEIMAQELVDLYGYPREKIFLSGIPQFDVYVQKEKFQKRSDFFASIGGDPNKALLLYMAASPSLFHDQLTILRDLIQAIQYGRLGRPTQLLIRFHPRTDMSDWIGQLKGPDVFFDTPSAAYSALAIKNGWKKEPEMSELANQIVHSDVVLNGFSTSALDAAALDKPVICYGYDGDPDNLGMVQNYYLKVSHFSNLLNFRGVRIAWNKEELVSYVNAYLLNPNLDSEGRKSIREMECFQVDGKAGQRIAQYLLGAE